MNLVALFTNDKVLQYRVNSILQNSSYSLETYAPPISEFLSFTSKLQATVILVSGSYLQSRLKYLDVLVSKKKQIIIYINHNIEEGLLYNVMNEVNFMPIGIDSISSLKYVLDYMMKFVFKHLELEKTNKKFKEELSGNKEIYLAKKVLQTEKLMTEDEAHKFIREKAMKERKTKVEIAKMILERMI